MYVKTKELTIAAICLALSMLLILVESVLGSSTLFLLSFAGFLIGIVIRENGMKSALTYFIASVFLSMILAPDKIKMVVFIGAEAYLLLREASYLFLEKNRRGSVEKAKKYYFFAKMMAFHLLFVPILLFFPDLIMKGMDLKWKLVVLVVAEGVWYLFDRAYDHFQIEIWDRLKGRK